MRIGFPRTVLVASLALGAAVAVPSTPLSFFVAAGPEAQHDNEGAGRIAPRPSPSSFESIATLPSAFAPQGSGQAGGAFTPQAGSVPLALAAADFDEDGVADLAAGYGGAEGTVAVYRGNVAALYPTTAGRRQRGSGAAPMPFDTAPAILALPANPHFIVAGDFDGDGHADIVVAERRARSLYLLSGDGAGDFSAPRSVALDGDLTALASGEVDRADGLPDIIAGLGGTNRPSALVFSSPRGALRGTPETIAVSAEPDAFAIGPLTRNAPSSLAIAAGSELIIRRGDYRVGTKGVHHAAPGSIERIALPFGVRSMAFGAFDASGRVRIALAAADGTVHLLDTAEGAASMTALDSVRAEGTGVVLAAARVAGRSSEGLVTLDAANRQLHLRTAAPLGSNVRFGVRGSTGGSLLSIDLRSAPVAVLPMRLNADAVSDFVILQQGQSAPIILASGSGVTLTVTTNGDEPDDNTTDASCHTAVNTCTLRAAIQQANAAAGADTINFNIGTASKTIAPASPLPAVTDTVTIDATTQPGYSNKPIVELSGAGAGNDADGLALAAPNCAVRGLAINRFGLGQPLPSASDGISITSDGNIIEANFLGTTIGGTSSAENRAYGVRITDGAEGNLIGGTTAAARNVISGNQLAGVLIEGAGTAPNLIRGNYIGIKVTGPGALANKARGIVIGSAAANADGHRIGGTDPGAGNVISSNTGGGIAIFGSGNLVQGNLIGVGADGVTEAQNTGDGVFIGAGCCGGSATNTIGGTTPAAANVIGPNTGDGVELSGNAVTGTVVQGNYIGTNAAGDDIGNVANGVLAGAGVTGATIGGTAPGAANTIAGNGVAGVAVAAGASAVAIRRNSISANSGLEIDLNLNGVSANDAADPDTGGNLLQNFPVLSAANGDHLSTTVQGSLNSTPGTTFSIDVFSSPLCDPSGHGGGKTYLGSKSVVTDGSGNVTFSAVVGAMQEGHRAAATATNPAGNTSEFSPCVSAVVPTPKLIVTASAANDSAGNGNGAIDPDECIGVNITVTNQGSSPTTGIAATLSSTTPGVTVGQPSSGYPDIAIGSSATNITPFQLSTAANYTCGLKLDLTLSLATDQGTFTLPVSFATGSQLASSFSTSVKKAIPDDNGTGVKSPVTVSGFTGAIAKVTVAFFISHTWVSDLEASLIGPDGTTVLLTAENGDDTDNYGTSCPVDADDTLFDDAAANSIIDGVTPFVGSFRPEESLSAFDGKAGAAVNGAWKLHVKDGDALDVGRIECWKLTIAETVCVNGGGACGAAASADVSIVKSESVDPAAAGGALTYTLAVANAGPHTAAGVVITDTLPAGVTYTSASASQGTCSQSNGTVTCSLGSIVNGGTASASILVSPQQPGPLSNTATVTAQSTDPDPNDNSSTVNTTVVSDPPPSVTVVRPNGGEKLYAATPYFIEWIASDNAPLASFDVLFTTNGTTYSPVPGCSSVAGSLRKCTWSAPGPLSTTARIRVVAHDSVGSTATDDSNGTFSILSGAAKLTVKVPNTALNWGIGSTQQIKWSHNLGTAAFVLLEISRNGGANWSPLAGPLQNSGATSAIYNWVVTGPATNTARIRVSWTNGARSDISNANFTIAPPFITVTAPASNVFWAYKSKQTLTWVTNLGKLDTVAIRLSMNGSGGPFGTLLLNNVVATKRTATVTTPNGTPTSQARVKVEWIGNPAVFGVNPADIQIGP